MSGERFDTVVVGAGIVGLSVAREVLIRAPGSRVLVVEKEPGPARHQSGHNSGVIHSGLYYKPGSAKARLCVRGAAAMYDYCGQRGIAVERCGKLVVATSPTELEGLAELHRRGTANGVPGLRWVDEGGIRDIEPHIRGLRAVHVPSAGIVDYAAVSRAYAADVVAMGGEIRYDEGVIGLRPAGDSVNVRTRGSAIDAERFIGCAGLWSDRLAALAGASPSPRIVPFRGDYYRLRLERRTLVRGLVYPVPDPRFPFLGIHFTRRIDGDVWLGPNAVLAFARDGYRRTDVRWGDVGELIASRGFRRLARRHWRTGVAELWRDISKSAFLRELRRYMPELAAGDLLAGPSGVRAQAVDDDGGLIDDFVVDVVGRVVNVRNAPSPAATSSLAIASEIVDRVSAVV